MPCGEGRRPARESALAMLSRVASTTCGVHLLRYACDQQVLARVNDRWADRPV
jgi:hypothetical protein